MFTGLPTCKCKTRDTIVRWWEERLLCRVQLMISNPWLKSFLPVRLIKFLWSLFTSFGMSRLACNESTQQDHENTSLTLFVQTIFFPLQAFYSGFLWLDLSWVFVRGNSSCALGCKMNTTDQPLQWDRKQEKEPQSAVTFLDSRFSCSEISCLTMQGGTERTLRLILSGVILTSLVSPS